MFGSRPTLPGGHPLGQVYALTVRVTESSPTRPSESFNVVNHVTVVPGGGTYMFIDCAVPNSA